jgi:hypothetical protein
MSMTYEVWKNNYPGNPLLMATFASGCDAVEYADRLDSAGHPCYIMRSDSRTWAYGDDLDLVAWLDRQMIDAGYGAEGNGVDK